ncbi:hypothetical protein [Dehalogenimonas alkenigignens]|uniref:hypothetical protein n=1 Tax=Dehalogenimonas alkenigignens TaxID=1217799 RepID=UPI000D56EA3F|nr:hypothetical protein [Dehalogenimonas alkenigignens]PVV84018.1 hypothetical protein DD509_04935 [Dehalogenimonas alkenigignens]
MFDRFLSWASVIQSIGGLAMIASTVGLALRQWALGLDTEQRVYIIIGFAGVGLVILSLILKWAETRRIDNLPVLLGKLDFMVAEYVDKTDINLSEDETNTLFKEQCELFKMDYGKFIAAMKSKDKARVKKAFTDMGESRARLLEVDPKKSTKDTLHKIMHFGALLDNHDVGLERLKQTPQYKKLYNRIQKLIHLSPSALINMRTNDYFNWSEGLYCSILSNKQITNNPEFTDCLPVEALTSARMMRQLVERTNATLITSVREAIRDSRKKVTE